MNDSMQDSKSKPEIERLRLYAIGSKSFAKRIRAAAALRGVTQEAFLTEVITKEVNLVIASEAR